VQADSTTDVGDIVIDRGGTITGRVIDASSGEAIAGAFVGHEGVVGLNGRRRRVRTNSNGEFTITGVPSGQAALYVRAAGYLARLYSGVAVVVGAAAELGDISLTLKTGKAGMQYSGVGVSIAFRNDRVMLTNVFAGGPAAQAGLEDGTAILRINGISIGELNPNQVVQMIRGEPGSEVALDIIRPGSDFQESIRIERGDVIAQ
jgi:membrane-associated protease RseP (regulator of RpoE activity)